MKISVPKIYKSFAVMVLGTICLMGMIRTFSLKLFEKCNSNTQIKRADVWCHKDTI